MWNTIAQIIKNTSKLVVSVRFQEAMGCSSYLETFAETKKLFLLEVYLI